MEGVKIHLELSHDQDGYPPVSVETVWAQPTAISDEFVIDSVPFFSSEVNLGDIVRAVKKGENWWFDGIVQCSDNSLVRVVFFDTNAVHRVEERLKDFGCALEYLQKFKLLAASVPINARLADLQTYLRSEAAAGAIDYEEPILRQ